MQFSMKYLLAAVAVISVLLVPIALLMNHSGTWRPAEHTADVLYGLAGDIIENNLTETEILELLKSPDCEHHGIHDFYVEIEKRPNELIWFAPNMKYNVGLSNDGKVIWMVNGKRSGER